MPFKSKKQERWMWANKPAMAAEWERHYGSYKKKKKSKK
jgi:hypothetical protein